VIASDTLIHVIQGEYAISDQSDLVMTTVLGSCVSACMFDAVAGLGGMNHFLLPERLDLGDLRFASAAMEQLVNALLKRGATRGNLQAKLFGGANMITGLPDIGRRNGDAALKFLKLEHIRCVSMSLGGNEARRVRFWPASGRAQQLLLGRSTADPVRLSAPSQGSIELF
jgi:chemotaxis protein CheD